MSDIEVNATQQTDQAPQAEPVGSADGQAAAAKWVERLESEIDQAWTRGELTKATWTNTFGPKTQAVMAVLKARYFLRNAGQARPLDIEDMPE